MVQELMGGREKIRFIVNGAKSWLIVNNSELAESAKKVFCDEVIIGSKEFKNQYCQEKLDKWPVSYTHLTLPTKLEV